MTDHYMKEILRVAVAQICQTIGYNATQTAPLELLQDVMDKFLREFTRDLRRQVEHYNRTEPNLDDMALTMNSINVNLNELLDYINNVEPVPFAVEVPKFPARKDSYLNFLKPGSKEVLTRPVHVHDHLPPMLPPEISQQHPESNLASTNGLSDVKPLTDGMASGSHSGDLMNGNDPSAGTSASAVLDKTTLQSLFKPASSLDDGDRPTREVSSVVMTTGGYISPAVEGKMPEAIIPDIIDKLLGLDAPPPPPPPPPPPAPTPIPAPVSRPTSRSNNSTPVPTTDAKPSISDEIDKDKAVGPSTSKESKKSILNKAMEITAPGRKFDDIPHKKEKLFKPLSSVSNNTPASMLPGKFNKKMLMQHNAAGGPSHGNQSTNYANMLLKKAKKQKIPLASQQPAVDKHAVGEKPGKLDPAEKTQRKYMKMLQKMAKQGKIPPDLLSTIMGPDKKSKMFNPNILASMPPGPEKLQLEKLLKKQAKQRQKIIKQQMTQEQKQKKSQLLQMQHPPPLVPLFTPGPIRDNLNKPLSVDLEEHKTRTEPQDLCKTSPLKSTFNATLKTPPGPPLPAESFIKKSSNTPVITETLAGTTETAAPPLQIVDGKEHKLSNEPDRSKLNIFKKISKQKTPKSSSPTPLRLTGLADTPIINLPSGTTITPAPGPGPSSSINRSLFPPLPDSSGGNVINLDDIKEKPLTTNALSTDVPGLNRVFGEKPPGGDLELANKPKKRGRKPGSKNAPKIPGAVPGVNNASMKKSKKMKMDVNLFGPPQIPQIPPEFAAAAATGNLTFDNVAHLFGNPLNPMEWAQGKQLQQQMMIMAAAKERKEQKKKNRLMKNEQKPDFLNNADNALSITPNHPMGGSLGPTSEEVQNINKKLMRMDTILKPAPSLHGTDLSVDTSLITGKKLPSPSLFPPSNTSTSPMKSPLKSPGSAATKRMLQGVDAIAAAAAAGLAQPYMLGNRPAFSNLSSNMLSMLPFAFPPRPGLIPTPGLFPTPGLGAFPNNSKNPLLPGLFPFPNLKQPPAGGDLGNNQDMEDLTINKKKMETAERSYCNVAPLVPEFLKLSNPDTMKHSADHHHHNDNDLPKTPKPRNSTQISTPQDHLHKKMPPMDTHTPESAASSGSKSIPSTPGGLSYNAYEHFMKKNDIPLELVTNKAAKGITSSQDSGLDFSINKKHTPPGLGIKPPPITVNNEPIEVSDDSDETSQPPAQPPPAKHTPAPPTPVALPPAMVNPPSAATFNMDEMFVANTGASKPTTLESDLSSKELKKLKKQVKKTSTSITTSLINPEKSEGVSKLAGGADLIPLASTGLAYSAKNIPFNSLTANANPTFNPHKSEFNTPSSAVFDNVTITAAIPSASSTSSNVFDIQKKRKEHKKLKKIKEFKEGKIKKKKDKKDKSKSKEKAEKYLLSQQNSPSKDRDKEPTEVPAASMSISGGGVGGLMGDKVKEKDILKKLKKEKKKEKQRSTAEETSALNQTMTQPSTTKDLTINATEGEKKQKHSPSSSNVSSSGTEQESPASAAAPTIAASVVPKLTLKLGSTLSPTPMDDVHHKNGSSSQTATVVAHTVTASPPRDNQREPSPELARISPLVTRPPKNKANPNDLASAAASTTSSTSATALDNFSDPNKSNSSSTSVNMIVPPPSPWLSGGTISASSVLLPHQLLQTTKQHDMTATSNSSQSTDNTKTHNTDRQSPLTLITETSRPSSYIDAEGHRVWICPACGKVDDGSPMIGCDGCDAWYHWVCVGIFVAPKDNEDWFCRVCITRKKGLHGSDKKRKRNKKK